MFHLATPTIPDLIMIFKSEEFNINKTLHLTLQHLVRKIKFRESHQKEIDQENIINSNYRKELKILRVF